MMKFGTLDLLNMVTRKKDFISQWKRKCIADLGNADIVLSVVIMLAKMALSSCTDQIKNEEHMGLKRLFIDITVLLESNISGDEIQCGQ